MRIWLNDNPIDLITGMTVRQALIQADLLQELEKEARVYDEWGNEMGLDGALKEGMRLKIKGPGQG
ncbi:MAG: hypothetical protein C0407_14060 [Desulfobacca sp.]|nr:hypothetical protein [Desulfobacca sp.]